MGEYLRQQMEARGWNIPRLAEACDVNPGLVARWVTSNTRYRVTPSPASCEKIAAALGVDLDDLLEMAGHRRRRDESRAVVSALRQAVRDQLDQWMSTVGPDKEEYFWQHLKVQGDSTVDLIRQVDTAVNAPGDAAVNAAVSARKRRGRKDRDSGSGPLKRYQHSPAGHFAEHAATTDRRRAA